MSEKCVSVSITEQTRADSLSRLFASAATKHHSSLAGKFSSSQRLQLFIGQALSRECLTILHQVCFGGA